MGRVSVSIKALLQSPAARDPQFLASVLALSSGKNKKTIWFERDQYDVISGLIRGDAKDDPELPQSEKPGDALKGILRDWLGIETSQACSCNRMASKMNRLGCDWCLSEAGMSEILGVMRTEHAKRWADGRTKLPWTDLGAKTLVKLACRRARAQERLQ